MPGRHSQVTAGAAVVVVVVDTGGGVDVVVVVGGVVVVVEWPPADLLPEQADKRRARATMAAAAPGHRPVPVSRPPAVPPLCRAISR
jgi:hypothetical protein